MANITVNTQSAAYQNRHADFIAIVQFWRPLLKEYFRTPAPQAALWRAADPFLNDLLRFCEAVDRFQEDNL